MLSKYNNNLNNCVSINQFTNNHNNIEFKNGVFFITFFIKKLLN